MNSNEKYEEIPVDFIDSHWTDDVESILSPEFNLIHFRNLSDSFSSHRSR